MSSISRNHAALLLTLGAVAACCLPLWPLQVAGALVLVLWLPGAATIRLLSGVRDAPGRGAMALAASLVLMPIVLNCLWRFTNARWALLALVAALDLALVYFAWRRAAPPTANAPPATGRGIRAALAALIAFTGLCVFAAQALPRGFDRMTRQAAHDYVKHHAVLLSLERHALPLHNPFYALEHDTPYYYYEYHYYIAATLRKLAGDAPSIAFAFGLSSAAVAAALIALVFYLGRAVLGSQLAALLAAACVSIIGGWDAIAVAIKALGGAGVTIVLDAWCPTTWRTHNLLTQYLWCPQHIAALLALVLAARWLQLAPRARWWAVIGPLLAAGVFGTSVYLAMTLFAAGGAYVLLLLIRLRRDGTRLKSALGWTAAALGITAALTAAQAWGYYAMNARFPGGLTTTWDRFPYAFFGRLVPPGPLANYLDAPWILLVDLGLPLVACLLVTGVFWRKLWADDGIRLLVLASIVGLVAVYTLRSDVSTFDYSFRLGIAPLQVVGALCAGALLIGANVRAAVRRWHKGILVIGVLLGLPVGLYEAPLMAVRSLVLAQPLLADGGAIRFIREQTPPDAVIQGDPWQREDLVQLTGRRAGVLNPDQSHVRVFFPRDEARWRATFASVERAFAEASSGDAHAALRAAGVTHVLAGKTEHERYGPLPQFDDRALFEPVYQDENAAVYRLLNAREP